MKFIINVVIIVILSIAVFTLPGSAQTDFSGNYVFKQKEHIKGPEYSNGVPTSITLTTRKDSVIVEYGSMDQDNKESKNRVAYAQDGKQHTSKSVTSGRNVTRSIKWSDDKTSFTTTSDIYKTDNPDEIELTRIDEFKLSPDGKQLLFHRKSVETITESWEVKGTYNKQ